MVLADLLTRYDLIPKAEHVDGLATTTEWAIGSPAGPGLVMSKREAELLMEHGEWLLRREVGPWMRADS